MATNSNIEWTNHTFNAWWGCTKVHDGCKNCYAEAWDRRWGGEHWGPRASRRMILGEWSKPHKWNAEAALNGVPARVFASSMCDVFEDFTGPIVNQQDQRLWIEGSPTVKRSLITVQDNGNPVNLAWLRSKLWTVIRETPNLRWLLLTKRPENIRRMVPATWLEPGRWPANVWTGTSPVNQETADKCIPELLKVPGSHFLSVEPMLGPVNLADLWLPSEDSECPAGDPGCDASEGERHDSCEPAGLHWVICGGESGADARAFDVAWALSLRDQCKAAGVPFFLKQLGAKPVETVPFRNGVAPCSGRTHWPKPFVLINRKGGDPAEWPEDLRIRELPGELT
ncbi:MAG: hypothetical protein AMXMBFR58_29420 [Phycisphaerae bacterium]